MTGLCFAEDRDFGKVQIKVTKVAGSVYMLQGAGGNIGASIGEDGPVSNLDDVRAYVKMLKETRAAVQDGLDKKMTLDQMQEEKILDPWEKYSGDFISEDVFLKTVYHSLAGQKNGEFVKHN